MKISNKGTVKIRSEVKCYWCRENIEKGDECFKLRLDGSIFNAEIFAHIDCENFRYLFCKDSFLVTDVQERIDQVSSDYKIERDTYKEKAKAIISEWGY